MNGHQRIVAAAGGLLIGITSSVFAQTPTTSGDLQAELAVMKARLAELEARQNDTWLNQRRTEEVKALIHDVLDDANTRASLLASGAVAGHDGKHFFLASQDGGFVLNVSGQVQVRYIYNSRESNAAPALGFDEEEFGFQLRRAKLLFKGHVGTSERFIYAVGLQTDRDDETIELDKAYFGYRVTDTVIVYGGEDKAPFLREELVSSSRQLTVERSLVNETFTAGRVQGVWATIEVDDHTKAAVAFTDGINSGEAGGTKDFHNDVVDFAFTARADMRLAGEWEQMKDFTAWSGQQQAVFVGAAVHYEIGETGDSQGAPFVRVYDEFLSWTVDGLLKSNGVSLFASLTGTHFNAIRGVDDLNRYGVVVQGAFMLIPDKLEPFLRWEWIDPDTMHQVNLVTLGANYYLNKHNAKFTADLVWAVNALNDFNSSGLGLLPDNLGEDDQVAVRAQFQLLF